MWKEINVLKTFGVISVIINNKRIRIGNMNQQNIGNIPGVKKPSRKLKATVQV